MSWQAVRAVMQHAKNQPDKAWRILTVIAEHADAQGVANPGPSQGTIADYAGCTDRTVRNWLPKLVASGHLEIVQAGGHAAGQTAIYRITLPMPEHGVAPEKAEAKAEMPAEEGGNKVENKVEELAAKVEKLTLMVETALSAQGGKEGGKNEALRWKNPADKVETALSDDPMDPDDPTDPEGEKAPPSLADDHELLAFLEANDIPLPETDDQRAQLTDPAVVAWLVSTARWPAYDNLPYIISRVGKQPNPSALKQAWQLWCAAGHRKGNIIGILDWYDELRANPGWKPADRYKTQPTPATNGHSPPGPEALAPIEKFEGGGGVY